MAVYNHYCWVRLPHFDTVGWSVTVEAKIALNQQYKKCHYDDYQTSLQDTYLDENDLLEDDLIGKGTENVCVRLMKESYKDTSTLRFLDEDLNDRILKALEALNIA